MLCYSKPLLLMADDDDTFLSVTEKYLEKYLGEGVVIKTFSSDQDVIEYLDVNERDYFSNLDIYQEFLKKHLTLDKTLRELELYHPILLIDQNLRGTLTGTDICLLAKNKNPNISIILLTGEIDYQTATKLHNEGLIDSFFRKDESDLIKQLSTAISIIINQRKTHFLFDGELSVKDNIAIALDADYRVSLNALLSSHSYQSYMIMNKAGDLVIKERNNKVKLFNQFDTQGTFKEYVSSNI